MSHGTFATRSTRQPKKYRMKSIRAQAEKIFVTGPSASLIAERIAAALDDAGLSENYQVEVTALPIRETARLLVATHLPVESGYIAARELGYVPGTTEFVLNLEDPAAINLSNEIVGGIHWVAHREPREILGALLDQFHGARIDFERSRVELHSGLDSESISLSHVAAEGMTAMAYATLAALFLRQTRTFHTRSAPARTPVERAPRGASSQA